jgi:hypothetical protein
MIGTLSVIIICCSHVSWASSPINQKSTLLTSTYELIGTSLQKGTSTGTGKIDGKVTNTDGLPLSDMIISIQFLTEETAYGSAFEDVATTDKKGKFEITGLTPGKYIVRATPSSDEFYLPNDKFNVTVKSNKTKKIKIKLSAASHTSSEYVGSTVCLGCHPEHEGTAHATTIRTPTSETVVAPFRGDIITTSDGKVKFKPFIEQVSSLISST